MKLRNVMESLIHPRTAGTDAAPSLCAAGLHPRDSTWKDGVCMYCQAEMNKRQKTAMLPPGAPGEAGAVSAQAGPPPRSRGRTRIIDPAGASSGAPEGVRGDSRRIVGVLVTFTWQREGELFVVRTGKNSIGANADADISIASDPTMSGEHAFVLYQTGICYVNDRVSANGTWLNGKVVAPGSTQQLENYATIKTGSTVWTFIEVRPGKAAAATVPADTQTLVEDPVDRVEEEIEAEAVEAERQVERERERERQAEPDPEFERESRGRKRPPTIIN
jgi:hypothetical protein